MSATPPFLASPRLQRFPWPFPHDTYRYSTNVEPTFRHVETEAGGWGGRMLEIDGDYQAELAERRAILERDPSRMALLEHMRPAAWDALETVLSTLAGEYPDQMEFTRSGRACHWVNRLLGEDRHFAIGDRSSLPGGPLGYLSTQMQEDVALPERLHLRVEVQHLVHLPRSGAIMFLIRTHLASLAEIAAVPAWRERRGRVLAKLPQDMAEYKGIGRYPGAASAWLLDR